MIVNWSLSLVRRCIPRLVVFFWCQDFINGKGFHSYLNSVIGTTVHRERLSNVSLNDFRY